MSWITLLEGFVAPAKTKFELPFQLDSEGRDVAILCVEILSGYASRSVKLLYADVELQDRHETNKSKTEVFLFPRPLDGDYKLVVDLNHFYQYTIKIFDHAKVMKGLSCDQISPFAVRVHYVTQLPMYTSAVVLVREEGQEKFTRIFGNYLADGLDPLRKHQFKYDLKLMDSPYTISNDASIIEVPPGQLMLSNLKPDQFLVDAAVFFDTFPVFVDASAYAINTKFTLQIKLPKEDWKPIYYPACLGNNKIGFQLPDTLFDTLTSDTIKWRVLAEDSKKNRKASSDIGTLTVRKRTPFIGSDFVQKSLIFQCPLSGYDIKWALLLFNNGSFLFMKRANSAMNPFSKRGYFTIHKLPNDNSKLLLKLSPTKNSGEPIYGLKFNVSLQETHPLFRVRDINDMIVDALRTDTALVDFVKYTLVCRAWYERIRNTFSMTGHINPAELVVQLDDWPDIQLKIAKDSSILNFLVWKLK